MALPYIGGVSFDNVSGDIPRALFAYSKYEIPGVNGTGIIVEGQRFPEQTFRCMALCVNQSAAISFKDACESLSMTVVPMQNSLGEGWGKCLVLNVNVPANATDGCLARNVPNGDGSVRPICTRIVEVEITVQFQFSV